MSFSHAPLVCLLLAVSLGGCSSGSSSRVDSEPGSVAAGGNGGGGNGGFAGSGAGAVGGVIDPGPACSAPEGRCVNGIIEPAVRTFTCMLASPPVRPEACDGTESLVGPAFCPSGGEVVEYLVTVIALDDDCDSGYDLDGCDGQSCAKGDIAPNEGLDGIDNAVAGLADLVDQLGSNLGAINQVFYDGLCNGLDLQFSIDVNSTERCATVAVTVAEGPLASAFMNVSEDGCVSGSLGTLLFTTASSGALPLDNTRIRVSLSPEGFSDGLLGATVNKESVEQLASNAIGIAGAAVAAGTLDINQTLEVDPEAPCDAVSLSLKIGGVRVDSAP